MAYTRSKLWVTIGVCCISMHPYSNAAQNENELDDEGAQYERAGERVAPSMDDKQGSTATLAENPSRWEAVRRHGQLQGEYRVNWYDKKEKVKQGRQLYEHSHALYTNMVRTAFKNELDYYRKLIAQSSEAYTQMVADVEVLQALREKLPKYYALLRKKDAEDVRLKKTLPHKIVSDEQALLRLDEVITSRDHGNQLIKGLQASVDLLQVTEKQCEEYDKASWKSYEALDYALDQKSVDLALDELKSHQEYIESMATYLQQQVSAYRTQMMRLLQENQLKVQQAVQACSTDNIPLKIVDVDALIKVYDAPSVPSLAWYQRVWAWITSWLTSLWATLR